MNFPTEKNPLYDPKFIGLTSELVASYVANNSVPATELPNLILKVYGAVSGLTSGSAFDADLQAVEVTRPSPAQIRKSIQQDGIVSFIDGKTYKTLKRHLTANGLSPQSYRERFGLSVDYPMVAPSYAAQRSALAKAIGLGQPGAMTERSRKGRKVA
ncbi:MucR family transcriptional regulator [Methylobacterium brachiatum]|jgi:predicted transcriptional regulator|uniref:MucR family transcriptional regulator n=1 Tax=Methylobacterium brachiatum TaxID=269660 RepID=A0ABV1RAZ2_9HYPH